MSAILAILCCFDVTFEVTTPSGWWFAAGFNRHGGVSIYVEPPRFVPKVGNDPYDITPLSEEGK